MREDEPSVRRERDLYRGLLQLGAVGAPERFVEQALAILVELSSARLGYLEIRHDGAVPLSWWAAEGCDPDAVETIRRTISTGIVAEALATRETVVTAQAVEDPRFRELPSVQAEGIEAVLCVPIGDEPFGVVYLQGDRHSRDFSPYDAPTRERVEFVARAIAPFADRLIARHGRASAPPAARAPGFEQVIGASRVLEELLSRLSLVAKLDVHLLLTGPSGSGKTMLAQGVHAASPRRSKSFVELNCAAIPESLFESELFGAAPGAHSAVGREGTRGKVEAAEEGTLFLDEVAELSLGAQAKLLQLLQDKLYYRLGSSEARRADVRIIAATNVELAQVVKERRFREDLYYRLRVIEARVPALSERADDIVPLARHFCRRAARLHGLGEKVLTPSALSAVALADWPGNIRELANRIESGVLNAHLRGAESVAASDVFPQFGPDEPEPAGLTDATRRFQRRHVASILDATDWNVSEAARRLEIARSHLYTLIRSYDLRRAQGE